MIRYDFYPKSKDAADFVRRLDRKIASHLRKTRVQKSWKAIAKEARAKYDAAVVAHAAPQKPFKGMKPKKPEPESKWSLIKKVYVKLQHGKCGYCERFIGMQRLREQDIEHFRPKLKIDSWTPIHKLPPSTSISTYDGVGYLELIYDPLNYLLACETCNQQHKKNFFPAARQNDNTVSSVRQQIVGSCHI
jgi:hypothetical protein